MNKILGIAAVLGLMMNSNAFARDVLEGDVLFELTTKHFSNSSDRVRNNDEDYDTYVTIEPKLFVNLNDYWRINNHWLVTPVNSRDYTTYTVAGKTYYGGTFYGKEDWVDRDLHVDDYGAILEELELQFQKNDFKFGIGKFNPEFGVAFSKQRYHGLYGTELPEEYELTEKIGASMGAVFDSLEIEASAFFDDTTDLSDSAFTNRGRDKSSGGAGNTERPDSWSVALKGNDLFGMEGLNYNAGFRRLAVDKSEQEAENGWLGGLEYAMPVGSGMIIPFAEIAYFENYEGINSRNTLYKTYSLTGLLGNWNAVISDTIKTEEEDNFSDIDDYLFQYSVGYKFESGLMFDLGVQHRKQTFKTDVLSVKRYDSLGGNLSYLLRF